jgi:hypothetical protein
MTRDCSGTPKSRAPSDISVSRSMTLWPLRSRSMSDPLGRADRLCPVLSFLVPVKNQNSDNRMTLKLVKYLYRGALACCFAQSSGKISGIAFPNTTFCDQ